MRICFYGKLVEKCIFKSQPFVLKWMRICFHGITVGECEFKQQLLLRKWISCMTIPRICFHGNWVENCELQSSLSEEANGLYDHPKILFPSKMGGKHMFSKEKSAYMHLNIQFKKKIENMSNNLTSSWNVVSSYLSIFMHVSQRHYWNMTMFSQSLMENSAQVWKLRQFFLCNLVRFAHTFKFLVETFLLKNKRRS